jgi:hypothetical protein
MRIKLSLHNDATRSQKEEIEQWIDLDVLPPNGSFIELENILTDEHYAILGQDKYFDTLCYVEYGVLEKDGYGWYYRIHLECRDY